MKNLMIVLGILFVSSNIAKSATPEREVIAEQLVHCSLNLTGPEFDKMIGVTSIISSIIENDSIKEQALGLVCKDLSAFKQISNTARKEVAKLVVKDNTLSTSTGESSSQ